jgi:outer membrane murein-binding lipoprotein Lpp
MSLKSTLLAGAVTGLILSAAMPAFAAGKGSEKSEIDELKAEVQELKSEVQALKGQQQTTQAQAQAAEQKVDTAVAAVAKVTPPKGKKGLQIGAVTVTPGGFIEAAGIYRDKNMTSDIGQSFNAIPYPNSSNYHIDENRFTARQSRLSLLATSDVDSTTHAAAYYEMDFLGAAGTANSKESNSYNLRIRNIYGTVDWDDLGLHLLAGQSWSLATMYSKGLLPRDENVPLTIDAQYAVGFDWARQPGFRIVKDFGKTLWLGLSVENAQTTFAGTTPTGAGYEYVNAAVGGGLFDTDISTVTTNSTTGAVSGTAALYSLDAAPDIVAKAAWDPGFGHYEAYGIARFFRNRTAFQNRTDVGGGVGVGAIVPVVPKMLDLQISGLVGQGIGRYGTGQLPDVTFGADGGIHPLTEYHILAGAIAHPNPALDVYLYGGIEHADRWSQTVGSTNYGYGNPNSNLSGCHTEGGSCSPSTRDLMEGTAGFWWKFYQGDFGSVRWGAQYEYVARNAWGGVGGGGTADNNIFMTSFRFYPF